MEKAGVGGASVRMVNPTGPLVSAVSTGSVTNVPALMSSLTSPQDVTKNARVREAYLGNYANARSVA
jgi:hypothetical protein